MVWQLSTPQHGIECRGVPFTPCSSCRQVVRRSHFPVEMTSEVLPSLPVASAPRPLHFCQATTVSPNIEPQKVLGQEISYHPSSVFSIDNSETMIHNKNARTERPYQERERSS